MIKICVKVALEVLSYHNAASIEEVEMVCNQEQPTNEEPDNIELHTSVIIQIITRLENSHF